MLRVTICLTMFLTSCGMVAEIHAAEVPVAAFPANSGVVIRIGDVDATLKKVKELAAVVEPDENKRAMAISSLDLVGPMAGAAIDNPAKVGIKPETDSWIAAIAKGGQEEPVLIIAIQPSDVAAVKDAVGDAYTYIEYENWLLYTKDEEAAKSVKACVAGDAPSIEPEGDETTQAIFMKSDVAVFVHIKELVKTYKDELDLARGQVDQVLSEAENSVGPQVQGMDMNAVFNMYRDLFSSLLTVLEESNSCTFGVSVSSEGIHFDEYLNVKPETATSKFLAKHPQATLKSLNMLPVKQPVYLGVSADMVSISQWGMELVKSMMGDDKKAAAELDSAMEKMKELELGEYVTSLGLGDLESGLLRSATISEVADAKQTKGVYTEMFKAMSKMNNPVVKQQFVYEADAEKVGGQSVDTLTVKQEFDESIDPTGVQKEMMEKMYGPGGAVSRLVYLDNHVVQTLGGGTDALAALLKSVKSPSSDAVVEATRSQLAPEANLVALVDLPSLVIRGIYVAAEAGLLDPSVIPELDIQRSYLGYSVAVSAKGVDVDAHVPAEQIKGLYIIGMTAFMMFSAQ